MAAVTVLHPGMMGAAVAAQAKSTGVTVRWVSTDRSSATRDRAAAAGLEEYDDLATALAGSDIVLSICPPANAEDVAQSVTGFDGVFLEANAIAPERTRRIAALLPKASVIDGGIIGGPPTVPGTTRLYLSGPSAPIVELFAGTALEVIALPGDLGTASALKLAYASYQKASRVLAALSHALARHHGVGDQLLHEAELLHSRPLLDIDVFRSVAARAWRWAPEMKEAAASLRDAGLPGDMAAGAAATLERWNDAKDRDDLTVDEVLELLTTPDPPR